MDSEIGINRVSGNEIVSSKVWFALVAVLAGVTLQAQEPPTADNDTLQAASSVLLDNAYRRVQGTNYDLRTFFDWQLLPPAQQQAVPRPAPEWSMYELRVVSIAPDGLVASPVSIDSVQFVGAVGGVYFLTNYPGLATTVVDQVIRVAAKRCGSYAQAGSEAALKLLDHGQPQPVPPRLPPPYDIEGAATENFRLLAREMEQMNLGVAAFQYRVGVRYLQGDGVTQDIARAISLFQLAADQGHPDAANRLKALAATKPPATPPSTDPIVGPVISAPAIGPVAPVEPVEPTPEPEPATTPTP